MQKVKGHLSKKYRLFDLEDLSGHIGNEKHDNMQQFEKCLSTNEKIILYHSENIDFYNTRNIVQLSSLINDNLDKICVVAHGVNKNFPFPFINHFDFWIEIKNRNNLVPVFDHSKDKSKDFLLTYRRQTDARSQLRKMLEHKGYLENSVYSFIEGENVRHLPAEYEHEKFIDPEFKKQHEYHEPAIWNIIPKQFNGTKFSIVPETVETNNIFCLSEKTFKPIIAGHISVYLAGAGYLKYLRSLGFKTFSNYIDESYDEELDLTKRIQKISDTCCQLLQTDHKKLYRDLASVTMHNRNLFFQNEHLSKLNTHIINQVEQYFK